MDTTATPPQPNRGPRAPTERYHAVAMWLHWLMAASILMLIAVGLTMESFPREIRFTVYQMHKTFGILVLSLTLARLAWRLMNPPPPLPDGMNKFEQFAASGVHLAFYAVMIGMPLTGWLMVSASPTGLPTLLFNQPGLVWPHVPGFAGLDLEARQAAAKTFYQAHELLAFFTLGLLALHVGAAVKHHLVNRDGVLARMAPIAGPTVAPTRSARGLWLVIALPVALLATGLLAGRPVSATAPAAEASAPDPLAASTPASSEAPAGSVVEPPPPASTPEPAAPVVAEPAEAPPPQSQTTPAPTPGPDLTVTPVAPPPSAEPFVWRVQQAASTLGFSGTHDGNPFRGSFARFAADIRFNPEALDRSTVEVTVDLASAATGNPFYDTTLREADWLAVSRATEAVFSARRFTRTAPGSYIADGTLTLRGKTLPLRLPFSLTVDGDRAEMTAAVNLARLDWDVGRVSDATGAWVGLEIAVDVKVVAEAVR